MTVGPRSCTDLFVTFNRIAIQGYGGVLAISQHELVERRGWMTREEFLEAFSLCQILPGPSVTTLAWTIGDRHFGLRGAFAALGGILLVPVVLVIALTLAYVEFAAEPMVANALRGMAAVVAGLTLATAVKLATALKKTPIGLPLGIGFAALTFVGIGVLHWPLVLVLGVVGPAAVLAAWWRLR